MNRKALKLSELGLTPKKIAGTTSDAAKNKYYDLPQARIPGLTARKQAEMEITFSNIKLSNIL